MLYASFKYINMKWGKLAIFFERAYLGSWLYILNIILLCLYYPQFTLWILITYLFLNCGFCFKYSCKNMWISTIFIWSLNTWGQSLSKKDVRSCCFHVLLDFQLIHTVFLTEILFKDCCESTLLSLVVYVWNLMLDTDGVSSQNK